MKIGHLVTLNEQLENYLNQFHADASLNSKSKSIGSHRLSSSISKAETFSSKNITKLLLIRIHEICKFARFGTLFWSLKFSLDLYSELQKYSCDQKILNPSAKLCTNYARYLSMNFMLTIFTFACSRYAFSILFLVLTLIIIANILLPLLTGIIISIFGHLLLSQRQYSFFLLDSLFATIRKLQLVNLGRKISYPFPILTKLQAQHYDSRNNYRSASLQDMKCKITMAISWLEDNLAFNDDNDDILNNCSPSPIEDIASTAELREKSNFLLTKTIFKSLFHILNPLHAWDKKKDILFEKRFADDSSPCRYIMEDIRSLFSTFFRIPLYIIRVWLTIRNFNRMLKLAFPNKSIYSNALTNTSLSNVSSSLDFNSILQSFHQVRGECETALCQMWLAEELLLSCLQDMPADKNKSAQFDISSQEASRVLACFKDAARILEGCVGEGHLRTDSKRFGVSNPSSSPTSAHDSQPSVSRAGGVEHSMTLRLSRLLREAIASMEAGVDESIGRNSAGELSRENDASDNAQVDSAHDGAREEFRRPFCGRDDGRELYGEDGTACDVQPQPSLGVEETEPSKRPVDVYTAVVPREPEKDVTHDDSPSYGADEASMGRICQVLMSELEQEICLRRVTQSRGEREIRLFDYNRNDDTCSKEVETSDETSAKQLTDVRMADDCIDAPLPPAQALVLSECESERERELRMAEVDQFSLKESNLTYQNNIKNELLNHIQFSSKIVNNTYFYGDELED